MPDFSAKDVQRLRQEMGVGMMDAKRALTENGGDMDVARKWLLEKGLAKVEARGGDNSQGAIALATTDAASALVELKSETDFVAKSSDFTRLAQELAEAVAAEGTEATGRYANRLDELRVSLKENIELGRVERMERDEDTVLDSYLHLQNERGVNGVLVELAGGSKELAHDVAVHIAFARPSVLSRDEVPDAEVAEQRSLLEAQTRNEGKPEQALPKIVEGKLTGWFKRVPGGALLDQPFVKDEKMSVQQALGEARVVRFAQAEIGT